MGVVRNLFDGLTNALTGAGSTTDPRSYNRYHARCLSDHEIDAAYRGSWLCRKIIDKPAEEMVREWRDWQADAAQIENLEAEEKRLDIRNKVRRAEIMRGLGGAGMVLWVPGDEQAEPVVPAKLRAGSLSAVHVWHRSRFSLGPMIADWSDTWFGYPAYFEVSLAGGPQRFHPSRVAAFRGRPIPDIVGARMDSWFWGESTVQVVLDAVQNVDTAQNGFAALIKDARNRRVGIPNLTNILATANGEAMISKRVSAFATGESMFGATFFDAGSNEGKGGETIDDRQMVWAGIPEIAAMYMAAAAGAADIPATILLGKSPDGMNATGEGDLAVWEKTVKARQDLDLRPCLAQLDALLVPSALGNPDPAVWYQFAPLSTLSEKDEAATFFATMQAMDKLQTSDSIPDVAFAKGMQNLVTERGWVPGLDAALAEIPEDERFPAEDPAHDAEGGDLVSAGAGAPMEALPRRRAANDAMAIVDGLDLATTDRETLIAFIQEVGEGPSRPFEDAYNPDQPRNGHGEWTASGAIREHVTRAQRSGKEHSTTSLGKVSTKNAKDVLKHTGVSIAGHERVIHSGDIRHTLKSHGDPKREAGRQQVAIVKSDFARIPDIVESAHTITRAGDATGAKGLRLEYVAQIGPHEYRYVETVSGNKVVALKTMRKSAK